MDNVIHPDLKEYLEEYQLQTPLEPISHYEEGELEAQWLVSAGLSKLTKPYEEGREIPSAELETALNDLPDRYANAIRQRVQALNKTIRGRARSRYNRKPDIRDVFRDVDESSTGTRSRSATPDSLDSIPGDESWNNTALPSLLTVFDNNLPTASKPKQKLRRTPSAPLRGSSELFRGSQVRCDIPFYTADGIELLNFQRLGTIHIPRIRSGRSREHPISGSLSHTDLSTAGNIISNNFSTSPNVPVSNTSEELVDDFEPIPNKTSLIANSARDIISYEDMCNANNEQEGDWDEVKEPCTDINDISENDFKKLQSVLWLELAAIFDKNNVSFDKRKPFKRKRKEEGNLFGVSLNALIRRDQQVTGEVSTLVPLILQAIVKEIKQRGLKEEGILRIPGHKQKVEVLYNELEIIFYQKPEKVSSFLSNAGVHDLSALIKRWLRELPQPILACDLIQLFYQTHAIAPPDQYKAIVTLCLLLPHENRNTLRAILSFLNDVIASQAWNKMTKHNIATIMAPSLFPPRFIYSAEKTDIEFQVKMAAQCYHLTKVLITKNETLFLIPNRLLEESKSYKNVQSKKLTRKVGKSSDQNDPNESRNFNPNHVHRIII